MAYARAVKQFFDWCDKRKLELREIEPLSVAAYIEICSAAGPATRPREAKGRGSRWSAAASPLSFGDHSTTRAGLRAIPPRVADGVELKRAAMGKRRSSALKDEIPVFAHLQV